MYLGIDLGTSAVKALLVDGAQNIVDQASAALEVQRPQPLWSEQDPESWWAATDAAVQEIRARNAVSLSAVDAIGLSGQMHGATLLDAEDRVLRPAILWNDGRSALQCRELEDSVPELRQITGNIAMPGFTAPKLLWVAENEPDLFRRTARVLLPKDYLRLRLSGGYASDMSDSAGTLWMDVARRAWSTEMLHASWLHESAMPELFEGCEATGTLRRDVASQWGMRDNVTIAAGAGDNAAGAAGIGVVRPGDAFLSLGTSGVYFAVVEQFRAQPESAVHSFCHCLPDTWHLMSVILSAASCLSWVTKLTGAANEEALLAEIESAEDGTSTIFLPYLSGERTPHNDPLAKGVFFGMTHQTTRAELGRAVLEGVAFAFADGQEALEAARCEIMRVSVIGGGARSLYWGRILASALDRPLDYHAGGEVGPAFGAARLARLAATNEDPLQVCSAPAVETTVHPDEKLRESLARRRRTYRRLYRNLRDTFAETD